MITGRIVAKKREPDKAGAPLRALFKVPGSTFNVQPPNFER
jgi:hypothetical protein